MLTGKMTATWLILLTILGCAVVPVYLIWHTTIRPYIEAHPTPVSTTTAKFILILHSIPNSIIAEDYQSMLLHLGL
jgi:protoheme ferro-lyase